MWHKKHQISIKPLWGWGRDTIIVELLVTHVKVSIMSHTGWFLSAIFWSLMTFIDSKRKTNLRYEVQSTWTQFLKDGPLVKHWFRPYFWWWQHFWPCNNFFVYSKRMETAVSFLPLDICTVFVILSVQLSPPSLWIYWPHTSEKSFPNLPTPIFQEVPHSFEEDQ